MKKTTLLPLCLLLVACTCAQQRDSLSALLKLSMENLMDIPIYSVSKTEESTFEAPLSSTVITREQIRRAGCTSIMEALRLVPGFIVREQTNGNYDIHLRGLDNIPPNLGLIFFTSSTTLVMIDNHPVYNYLQGGTFWETLPVDLNDVEKIEVVRGPSAAMYGPNAVAGVINIITRKPEKDGEYAVANVRYGSYRTLIANVSAGYKWKKLSAVVSGNWQQRNRTQAEYYDQVRNEYVPLDSVTAVNVPAAGNINAFYPHRNRSMNKYGINGFVNYDPAESMHVELALGAQHAEVQKAFAEDSYVANLSTARSDEVYANMKASLHNFNVQLAYINGTQAPVVGSPVWKWDYNTFDAVAEYTFEKIRNLTITPGLVFRRAAYNDSKYVDVAKRAGFWNGKALSTTTAASLRTGYRLLDQRLRLVAAGRADRFNDPDKIYFSYELAATYKINDRNLVRAVYSKANRAPLILDLFSNLDLRGKVAAGQDYLFEIRGNKDIRLLTSRMFEVGYRSKLLNNLELDLEAFYTRTHDVSSSIFERGEFNPANPVPLYALLVISNVPLYVKQWGATLTLNYTAGNWQFRPFVTLQKTTLYNYSQYASSPGFLPYAGNRFDPARYNIYTGLGTKTKHQATPTCYGGAYINWNPLTKFNVNVNAYYYSNHTQLHSSNLTYRDGMRGVEHVEAKLILNAALLYEVAKHLTLSAGFKNCLNDRSVEFYKADAPAFMVLGGIHFEL